MIRIREWVFRIIRTISLEKLNTIGMNLRILLSIRLSSVKYESAILSTVTYIKKKQTIDEITVRRGR